MRGIINVPLIANPANWVIVLLMVVIGAFAADLLCEFYSQQPTTINS